MTASFRRTAPLAIAAAAAVLLLALGRTAHAQADTARRTSIGGDLEYVSFSDATRPWKLAALSVAERTARGSLTGHVTAANRFGQDGVQFEADAYPKLSSRTYAYLNLGYSAASIFPHWRSGAELYVNLPHAHEASLGYRQLRFTGSSPVTLYTGSLGKYVGNYWFSARPFFRSGGSTAAGNSASVSLIARRYLADADNYIGARLGFGSTPSDERLTSLDFARERSTVADVHGALAIVPRLFGTWTLGYEHERLAASVSRNRLNVMAGLRRDLP